MSGFSEMQSVLANWPQQEVPTASYEEKCLERLRRVLGLLRGDRSVAGAGDIAGLIRHVLRRESILNPDSTPALRIPRTEGWPDAKMWRDSHVDAIPQGQDFFLIRATKPWSAEWLTGSDNSPPLVASFAEERRRDVWPVLPFLPLDPALEVELGLDFRQYSCPGQRQAIRAAFLLKPGGTLVVNLPTGSGKSLVGWAPVLMAPRDSLTVMVTPTIALALDQERQLREKYPPNATSALPERLAWHSGLSETEKSGIRRRLFDGTQRILIASPESIVSSLARPLYESASMGRLKYFIVDEAHLVAQWGIEFRPEFQAMCGLRRELLAHCPGEANKFKTLLLSATLSQESFDTLHNLFSEVVFDHISAVTLRPEPEYWLNNARNETVRKARVVELIRVVPRPFLLYVTTHEQAIEWSETLKELGLRRSACVYGATPSDIRSEVVDQWRSGELDSVVATSAFGLGMDKSDVRAVIHACVPESIDRFYQEVGRGGRDGKACVSFLVHTEKDVQTARGIGSAKVITIEQGLLRWTSMIEHARWDPLSNRFYLNLNQKSPRITGDTAMNSAWNLRTVILLHRVGLISIESESPPEIAKLPEETEFDFQKRRDAAMRDYSVTCPVRLLDDGHSKTGVWEDRVEPVRQQLLQSGWTNFGVMESLLRGNKEIANVLAKVYELRGVGGDVNPVAVCGGCCVCRSTVERQTTFVLPEPDAILGVETAIDPTMKKILGTASDVVFVACDRSENRSEFRKKLLQFVLPRLVRMGIAEICGSAKWQEEKRCRELFSHSAHRFVIHRDLNEVDNLRVDLSVPRVTIFLPDMVDALPQEIINAQRPLHVIFAWDDTPERDSEQSRFFDKTIHTRFNDLMGRLSQ